MSNIFCVGVEEIVGQNPSAYLTCNSGPSSIVHKAKKKAARRPPASQDKMRLEVIVGPNQSAELIGVNLGIDVLVGA
jgi:hypothetical protein